jgi:virulence-associated protein VapD
MAQYAIAFDLDTAQMTQDGLKPADKTGIYQTEIPEALEQCGFTAHLQGSLYATDADQVRSKTRFVRATRERSTVTSWTLTTGVGSVSGRLGGAPRVHEATGWLTRLP